MKKLILTFIVLLAVVVLFTGCGGNELKTVRAQVSGVDMKRDTLKSMKATVDGDTLLFSLRDVRLNNGLMFPDDSVIVNYIKGHGDTLRALVVTVLPKAPHVIDLKAITDDSLLTTPPSAAIGEPSE